MITRVLQKRERRQAKHVNIGHPIKTTRKKKQGQLLETKHREDF